MSQGGQGATLPRFGRRLLAAGLVLDAAELVCCGVPLVLWLRNLPWALLWLKVALPLLLAVWGTAVLRANLLLRPLLEFLAAVRQGEKPKLPEADRIRWMLARLPREVAAVHFLGWVVVAASLLLHAVHTGERSLLTAVVLLQFVLVAAVGLTALRTIALDWILAPARPLVLPSLQGMRAYAERYRGRLLAVGFALLAFWQAELAFFAHTLVYVGGRGLASGMLFLWPVLLVAAWVWWRRLFAETEPMAAYLDVSLRAKGGKGPPRDDPGAVAAFIAAQRIPYALARVQGPAFLLAGFLAVTYLRSVKGLDVGTCGRLVLVVLLATGLAVFYQTLLLQQLLRPILAHLGSRHALPLDQVRAPLGLRAKLGIPLCSVMAACAAYTWLFDHAPPAAGWGPAPLIFALLLLLGVVLWLLRDVVSPLRALEDRSGEMARGQLARPVPPWGEADEIGRLAVIFEEMRRSLRDRLRSTESINVDLEREVRRRTEALEQRNTELHEALEKLRRAQDNLVRSEKLASMGRLVAGIAHEINNPVNAVINSLGPLEEIVKAIAAGEGGTAADLAHEGQEILTVVQRGAARTKAIVQALHGYARGDDSVQREVSLTRSVDETLGLLQHRLRMVKVIKAIDPNARILGFPGQIDQVLMNLLTNAAQAIGESGGTIEVSAANQDNRVLLKVADDGPGISPEVLPRIFDPFFTTKDVGEGAGLGLSIVHGIIERHGGQVEVESQPGKGTTFLLSFPLPPARHPPAGTSE